MNKKIAFILPFILSGCVVAPPIPTLPMSYVEKYTAVPKKENFPPIGKENKVEVGQSMVSSAIVTSLPIIIVSEAQEQPGINNKHHFIVKLPAGILSKTGFDALGGFYSYNQDIQILVGSSSINVSGGGIST